MNVKTLCLAVLAGGDATGYEIKKILEEGPVGSFFHAAFGSIYPALATLDTDGLVTCSTQAQTNRPSKKVYTITDAGRDALRAEMETMPSFDKLRSEALTMLYFAHLLDEDQRQAVFNRYLEQRQKLLSAMESNDCCHDQPGQRFVHEVGLAVYRAMAEAMETHKHLLFEPKDS